MQLRIKSNIAVSDTGFVFNPGTGDSYSINPIGAEIIRWMKAAQSEAEIINKLVEQYDTDNQTVEKDLYDFYNMLLQKPTGREIMKDQLCIAVSGLNNTDNPGPGIPVIRALRDWKGKDVRIIGLSYDHLEPGLYMHDLVDKSYQVPFPSAGAENLMVRLQYIHQQENIDFIFPNFDAELFTFMKLAPQMLEMGIHTFLPGLDQFEERHKYRLNEFGEKYGLSVPKSVTVSAFVQVQSALQQFEYPVVVKGKFYEAYIAYNPEQVSSYFHKIQAKWGLPVIFQQFVYGNEYNVVALGDGKGRTIGAVPMRKQFITDKGKAWAGITLEEPELIEMTEKLISASKWRGGMEIELIKDKSGKLYIVEINPRFPAWVYLAVASGQNMPEAAVKLAFGEQVKPFNSYEVGKMFVRYSWDNIVNLSDFEKYQPKANCNVEKLRYERPVITSLNSGITNKFGTRNLQAPVSHIDGVAVSSIVEKYGSPVFVISERKIRQLYRDAYRAFSSRYPKVQFAWSYKTNYINAVCNVFHQEGSWAEVVSIFEFKKALGNGVPGKHIIFNGPEKTDEDLQIAIEHDALIHIDHLDELYALTELSKTLKKRPRVAIRVNMDTGIYPMWDRFGFNYESGQAWDAINKIVLSDTLDLVGLHCHIGTFMLSPNAYAVAASKLSDLALGLKQKHNVQIEYLDLGGGFASKNTLKGSFLPGTDTIPDVNDYAEAICNTLLNIGFTRENLPMLILETGRALVDEAGYLISSVIANKRLSDGRRAMIVDAGVNILFTSFWYDHKISPVAESGNHTEASVVYGPLCMNIDVVRESVTLPPMKKGDQLVIHTVGAYNMTQWMQFIAMRPNVVLIDPNEKVHLIRKRETVDDLNNLESMPEHLEKFKL